MCSGETSRRLTGASTLMSGAFAGKWETPRMAAKESRAFAASGTSMPCPIGPGVSNRNEKPVPENIFVVLDGICNRRDDTRCRSGRHSLDHNDAGRVDGLSSYVT